MERQIDKPLLGQTVLVTGASGGIGAAIVERVALEGARPIIHYCKDEDAAESLLARINGNGLVLQADLSESDGPFALWRKAVRAGVRRARGEAGRAAPWMNSGQSVRLAIRLTMPSHFTRMTSRPNQ